MKKSIIILLTVVMTAGIIFAQDGVDLNFGGELKMRNRINMHDEGSKPGFEFYEIEFFLDADITDYNSFYIEFDMMHSNHPEPENVWMDLHVPMRPAYAYGGMGVRIGHFQVPFGYENDDNEGYMYHGRSSVNHSMIHGEKIDGWKMRNRQIGMCGAYSVGPVTAWLGAYNGNGNWMTYGKSDNQMWDYDWAGKVECQLSNIEFGGSYWLSPGVDPTDAGFQGNGEIHTRDITRAGVHAKWPATALFVAQDAALGGERFLVYGEYLMGEHKENDWDPGLGDQSMFGAFVETQFQVIPETVVGFFRFDYYEPNDMMDDDETTAITGGVNWFFWNSMKVIVEYDYITNKAENKLAKQDRIALEISTTF